MQRLFNSLGFQLFSLLRSCSLCLKICEEPCCIPLRKTVQQGTSVSDAQSLRVFTLHTVMLFCYTRYLHERSRLVQILPSLPGIRKNRVNCQYQLTLNLVSIFLCDVQFQLDLWSLSSFITHNLKFITKIRISLYLQLLYQFLSLCGQTFLECDLYSICFTIKNINCFD